MRVPNVGCAVVSGGFSQFGGLPTFIKQKEIRAILDVTHPYAKTMSTTAASAARGNAIPYWRFHREAWRPQAGDHWQHFHSWEELAPALQPFRRIFLTCGQLNQQQLNLLPDNQRQYWLRTAVRPKAILPSNIHWLRAIGPFTFEDETALFQAHGIDALVSKNSGGDATAAKLAVARERAVPVFMLARPLLPQADSEFTTHQQCQQYVLSQFNHTF